jgi:interleukin-1 receptor-associated kinase 1
VVAPPPPTWAQRLQVGLDVGLRYLHEYARPPCVHMDVSSGSMLLTGDGPHAKLRGFGAARAITGGAGADGRRRSR